MIVFTILNILLVILALTGFVLTLCTPIGVILLIIYLTKKKTQKSKSMLKWSVIFLSGIPLLIITFILYALVHLIGTSVGVNPLVNPDGGLIKLPLQ